jgi:hypothetical protein
MDDRRKLPRRHLYFYSRVFDEDTREMVGRLVDINTQGMMLISEQPIDGQSQFKFKLVLPKAIEGKKELHLEAESKWSRQALNQDLYDNGFRLVNVSSRDAEMIGRLINNAGFKY